MRCTQICSSVTRSLTLSLRLSKTRHWQQLFPMGAWLLELSRRRPLIVLYLFVPSGCTVCCKGTHSSMMSSDRVPSIKPQ
jgi:hypothetical protein